MVNLERQAESLRHEIEALLAPLSDTASFYDLVREPLTRVTLGLAAESARGRPWPLLPLMVCEAVSGDYERALPAAAAIQLLMAAADVFDDIEDADSPESLSARCGPALANNVATTLIILAETAITRLKTRGVGDTIIVLTMDAVNSFCTTACIGQHLDLSLNVEAAVSEDEYIRVAFMKSASSVECACHVGALLASANQELIETFAGFGHDLGIASQIANDIQGIVRGNDVVKRRITLPVVYALAQTDGRARAQLEHAFGRTSGSAPDPTQIRELLFRTGAVHHATIAMEFHKQRADEKLLEAEGAGARVERLKPFLE